MRIQTTTLFTDALLTVGLWGLVVEELTDLVFGDRFEKQ